MLGNWGQKWWSISKNHFRLARRVTGGIHCSTDHAECDQENVPAAVCLAAVAEQNPRHRTELWPEMNGNVALTQQVWDDTAATLQLAKPPVIQMNARGHCACGRSGRAETCQRATTRYGAVRTKKASVRRGFFCVAISRFWGPAENVLELLLRRGFFSSIRLIGPTITTKLKIAIRAWTATNTSHSKCPVAFTM